MKQFITLILLLPLVLQAQQQISVKKTIEKAQQHYPFVRQKDLLKQTAAISIENLSKVFLPQFNINAQATYQSDVTTINIPIPGVSSNPLSKDQYKILADVNQLIYDGGVINQQKNIQQLNENIEQQKVDVELYKLKEKIIQLYLSVLYLDEQLNQVDLMKADLNIGIKKTSALVNNGVAFKSNLNVLKAELL